ncbi:hypothetical protein FRC01_009262, partial [Tulasnella sp. 417]
EARRTPPRNRLNRVKHRASRRGRGPLLPSGRPNPRPLLHRSKATTPQARLPLQRTAARRLPSRNHDLNSSSTGSLRPVEVAQGVASPREAMQPVRHPPQPPKRDPLRKLRTLLRAGRVKERIKRKIRTHLQAAHLEAEVELNIQVRKPLAITCQQNHPLRWSCLGFFSDPRRGLTMTAQLRMHLLLRELFPFRCLREDVGEVVDAEGDEDVVEEALRHLKA